MTTKRSPATQKSRAAAKPKPKPASAPKKAADDKRYNRTHAPRSAPLSYNTRQA
jgi:hypothetical protein